MSDIRLVAFPTKTNPDSNDIVYIGDSSAVYAEKQSTIGQIRNTIQPLLTLNQSQVTNLTTDLSDRLVKTNNLSDVSNPITSLNNIGGQPKNIIGSGNPNGVEAGTAGVNIYFDTSTERFWLCTVTGSPATWEIISQESDIIPANIIYFSGSIGNDTTGNGSQSFPFQTYGKASSYAAGLASSSNQYAVFPMGNEDNGSSNIVLYPFVNFAGVNSDTNSLKTTGNIVIDSSWASTPNSYFSSVNVGLDIQSGVNITLTVPQGARFLFKDSPFSTNTPSITVTGTDSTATELFVLINSVAILASPNITVTNFITAIDDSSATNITSINNSSNKNSILVLLNGSLLDDSGTITVQHVLPGTGSVLLATSSLTGSLILDGSLAIAELDSGSYPFNINFLNGANFSNILLITTSDSISTSTFSPVNYTRPPSPSSTVVDCVTNDLAGIDNELSQVYASVAYSSTNFSLTASVTTDLNQAVFSSPDTSSDFSVNSITGVVTYNGSATKTFSIYFDASFDCTEVVQTPINFFYAKNGVTELRSQGGQAASNVSAIQYCSARFTSSLSTGDTINAQALCASSTTLRINTSTLLITKV